MLLHWEENLNPSFLKTEKVIQKMKGGKVRTDGQENLVIDHLCKNKSMVTAVRIQQ